MRDTAFDTAERVEPAWASDESWKGRFPNDEPHGEPRAKRGPLVVWYGDTEPEPPPYLVQGLLPQTQTAILAGQFSAGKTFLGVDLAVAVMLGLTFAGRRVERQGAVVWLAAEGANEVDARVKAAALHRTGADQKGKLPFCRQAFNVPTLTSPEAFGELTAIIDDAKAGFQERFDGLPLALIVVDTMNSAASFADQNDGAEAQRVMALGRRLSNATGALVLFIDHFGKVIETGVKGSSDKGNAADAILSALADKDAAGTISNRRLATFKLRNGPTGDVLPFKLVQVPISEWGTTTCAVEWQQPTTSEKAAAGVQEPKPDWTGNGRVFKAAMVHAMLEHSKEQRPFGFEAKPVKAVEMQRVRKEFYARYPAETQEAKKKAFGRELTGSTSKALIASREIGGVDWLWFVKPADEADTAHRTTGTPGGQGTGDS